MTFWGHNVQKCVHVLCDGAEVLCMHRKCSCSASVISMQTRFAPEPVPPSSLLPASQACFPRGLFCLASRQTQSRSHLDRRRGCVAAASTPPSDSLINLSVFARAQLWGFFPSLFVSRSQFISTPSSRLIFRPLHPLTSIIPPIVLFFYISSLLLSCVLQSW